MRVWEEVQEEKEKVRGVGEKSKKRDERGERKK